MADKKLVASPLTVTKGKAVGRPRSSRGLPSQRQANTPLGLRLTKLRARVVASGDALLGWEALEREVEERRGGLDEQV